MADIMDVVLGVSQRKERGGQAGAACGVRWSRVRCWVATRGCDGGGAASTGRERREAKERRRPAESACRQMSARGRAAATGVGDGCGGGRLVKARGPGGWRGRRDGGLAAVPLNWSVSAARARPAQRGLAPARGLTDRDPATRPMSHCSLRAS